MNYWQGKRIRLRAIGLHEKLGFQKEGCLRRMIFTQGGYVDNVWYGMTVEEFRGATKETRKPAWITPQNLRAAPWG
jgi:hypothetical protein